MLPSPSPITVTDMLPVLARFSCTTLDKLRSYDTASVTLPALPPAVTTIRCVPATPDADWHTTDVSDTHSLASHPVDELRPAAV